MKAKVSPLQLILSVGLSLVGAVLSFWLDGLALWRSLGLMPEIFVFTLVAYDLFLRKAVLVTFWFENDWKKLFRRAGEILHGIRQEAGWVLSDLWFGVSDFFREAIRMFWFGGWFFLGVSIGVRLVIESGNPEYIAAMFSFLALCYLWVLGKSLDGNRRNYYVSLALFLLIEMLQLYRAVG